MRSATPLLAVFSCLVCRAVTAAATTPRATVDSLLRGVGYSKVARLGEDDVYVRTGKLDGKPVREWRGCSKVKGDQPFCGAQALQAPGAKRMRGGPPKHLADFKPWRGG